MYQLYCSKIQTCSSGTLCIRMLLVCIYTYVSRMYPDVPECSVYSYVTRMLPYVTLSTRVGFES